MKKKDVMLAASIRNSGVSALLCATLGFALLEAWIIRLGARPITHVIVVSIGAVLAAIIYRAIVRFHASTAVDAESFIEADSKSSSGASLGWAALLIVFGYAGSAALSGGSMTLFAAFAACAFLFPWSKAAFCRTRILGPLALITLPLFYGISTADRLPQPMFLPVAVWMLWTAAAGAWLRNISYRRQKLKASEAIARHQVDDPASVMHS